MNRKFFYSLLGIPINMVFASVYSQEVVATAGDHYTGDSFSISFTIGEPVIETFESSETILTQGFQQSDLTVTRIHDPGLLLFEIKVYPNPTKSAITVSISEKDDPHLTFRLVDTSGKILFKGEFYDRQTTIRFNRLPPATYFLHILDQSMQIATYKIIKQ